MNDSAVNEPAFFYNSAIFSIPFPAEIAAKTPLDGISMSFRDFFESMACKKEDYDPKYAALLREAASYYPEVDLSGLYPVERDSKGNALYDFDDWDEISDEKKINRGNINAAIAALDRLRFDLEMTGDGPEHADRVTNVRRKLAELAYEWEDYPHPTLEERLAKSAEVDPHLAK